jgi:cytoskeleton protein RodZ
VTATQERLPGDAGGSPPAMTMESPGARLRAAREAAGLSLDQVAQQLKLAQRQVKALEDENFGELPGRTFSRGFVRNYARLLNLDPEDLLQRLPDVAHAPALGSPALHSTGAMMAELPSAAATKTNIARWLIPLGLIACIVAAGGYEWYRGGLGPFGEAPRTSTPVQEPKVGSGARTSLPNPLAGEGRVALATPSGAAEDKPAAAPIASASVPAASTPAIEAPAVETPAAPEPADAPLVLSFSGPSWTEIRDHSGQLVLSGLVSANAVEPVRGAPPFDVVLGNAKAVTLSYRGKTVDLTPYTRQNVARLTLP